MLLNYRPLGLGVAVFLGVASASAGESGGVSDRGTLDLEATRVEDDGAAYKVPALEYAFEQHVRHPSPMEYLSVKDANLPLALHHRLDAIWAGSMRLAPHQRTASDYPVVGEIKYRLRSSPWSDPERMVEARLLDGTNYRMVVTQEFGTGRTFDVTAAVQHAESLFHRDGVGSYRQASMPVEVRTEMGRGTELIAGAEVVSSWYQDSERLRFANEAVGKIGLGMELGDELYGQVTGGSRVSQLNGGDSRSAFDLDAALIWQQHADTQYTLTFNRSNRPSLLANRFVDSETISFSGDYTLSDLWSARFGVADSWADFENGTSKEIFSSELSVRYSPTESISFSGGYIYRSGSLRQADEDDEENIVRFSASLLY